MAVTRIDKVRILQAVDELSDESLLQLAMFLDFLRFKERDPDSMWAKAMVERFSHVQDAVEASGMTEDEINQMIEEAVDEVRGDS